MADLVFLDVASTTGVASGEVGGRPLLSTQRFAKADDKRWEAAGRAALWMAARIDTSRPTAVYIEAPVSFGGMKGRTNSRTLGLLNELATGCAAICRAHSVPVFDPHVSTIRKWFLGTGDLRGPDAKREVLRITRALGWSPANEDEGDAAAGWAWACALYDKGLTPPSQFWNSR